MSVASRNPFALLNEDGEPIAPVSVPAAQAPAAEAPVARQANGRGGQSNKGPRRGNGYYKRGGAPGAAAEDSFSTPNPNEPGQRFDGERGRGRGRGGRDRGRGGRGRGEGVRHGRNFDKQSQTGIVDSEKQVAQGWGAETGTAELQAEAEGLADAKAETSDPAAAGVGEPEKADADGTVLEGKVDENGAKKDEEEEDNTLTLEEYLAKKKSEEASALPTLEKRQVAEDGQWKDAVQLLREENSDVYFAGKSKSSTNKSKSEKAGKVYLEIDAQFERPQRDGRGRGRGRGFDRGGDRGRGERRGGRGGRGRGDFSGPRGGRTSNSNVDVDDQTAFPSLA